MQKEDRALKKLTDFKSNVSSHYFIRRNGKIIQLVPDLYTSWHAGKSNWKKHKSLNKYSIGIEISNKGHEYGYQKFTNYQIKSLIKLSKKMINKYKIKKKNILGHSDIAFNRKKDPGEKFPWKYLAKNKIGIWHNLGNKSTYKYRKFFLNNNERSDFLNFLKKIGYFVNNFNSKKKNLIIAFQRRFRPEVINGKLDKECYLIAKKLSKLYN